MKDKRQGNDLKVAWSIFNQDGEPFRLEGKDVSLYLKNMFGRKELNDFVVTGNIIQWTFYGKDQKNSGKYSLEMVINEGEKGMITTDKCDFVNLVSCSCKLQGGEDAPNVETESIELTSTLEYVSGGGEYDDTALWKELENKVDKVEGLGLSEENYTTEDKEKLSGLENYDDSGIKKDLAKKAEKSEIPTKMSQLEQDIEIGGTPDWQAREGEEGYIKNKPFDFGTPDEYAVKEVEVVPTHEDGSYVNVTLLEWFYDEEAYLGYWENYDWLGEDPYLRISNMPDRETIITKPSELRRGKELWGLYIDSSTGNVQYNGYFQSETTIKVELAYSIIPLHESFIPETIARKSELTELSAEVSGLSERVDALGEGGSSVFEAVYGVTTYAEIVEAYNANKHVVVKWNDYFLSLSKINKNLAEFTAISVNTSTRAVCFASGSWSPYTYPLERETNKTQTINESSTDTQYPSAKAVYDALQNVGGGGGASKEWKCVADRRMVEGEKIVEFTTYEDGTSLQAKEVMVQVLCDTTASNNINGYVIIHSSTNTTDAYFGTINYEDKNASATNPLLQQIHISASPFFTIARIDKNVGANAASTSNALVQGGDKKAFQIYEDIVKIRISPNGTMTSAAPYLKVYAR